MTFLLCLVFSAELLFALVVVRGLVLGLGRLQLLPGRRQLTLLLVDLRRDIEGNARLR